MRRGTVVCWDGRHVDRTALDETVQFLLMFSSRDLLVQLFREQNGMSIRALDNRRLYYETDKLAGDSCDTAQTVTWWEGHITVNGAVRFY
jgi:hypothetical protein